MDKDRDASIVEAWNYLGFNNDAMKTMYLFGEGWLWKFAPNGEREWINWYDKLTPKSTNTVRRAQKF